MSNNPAYSPNTDTLFVAQQSINLVSSHDGKAM